MRLYHPIAEDRNCAFWKQGSYGYTFKWAYSEVFTDLRILKMRSEYDKWEELTKPEDFKKINPNGDKTWVIRAANKELMNQFIEWACKNIEGYLVLKNYEEKHGTI